MTDLIAAGQTPAQYYPNDHLYISNSSMNLFRSCPRKFEFRKVYEKDGNEQTIPGDAGNALHAGYQNWFVHRDKDLAIWEFMKRYPWHLNDNPNFNRSAEACYYTLERMMSCGLYSEYEIAHVVNDKGETVPAVEVPFEILLKDFSISKDRHIGVSYIGFIDLVLFNRVEEKHVELDIKSHRDNMTDLSPKWIFDEQCLPYAMVLERALGKEITDLEIHYMSAYIDIKEPEIRDFSFIKSKNMVRDWARHLLVDLQQIRMFMDMEWWPRNGNNCAAFRRKCQFMDFCHEREPYKLRQLIQQSEQINRRNKTPWLKLELELAA